MRNIESKNNILSFNRKKKSDPKKVIKKKNESIKKIDFNTGKLFTLGEVLLPNLEELGNARGSLPNQPEKFAIRIKIQDKMDDILQRQFDKLNCSGPYVTFDIDKLPRPESLPKKKKNEEDHV